ncbi:MAG: FeoA family protein [Kiritimatiellae bacterium]|nr:FeoA family protein [Kiritimatiellia bacterium]
MPLSAVQPGTLVRILAIQAGRHMQGRLAAMGLIPGVQLQVLRNTPNGPFLLSVMGSRLMLGRGMARKINVT